MEKVQANYGALRLFRYVGSVGGNGRRYRNGYGEERTEYSPQALGNKEIGSEIVFDAITLGGGLWKNIGEYSTIYRAVSQAEVDDIAEFGLRMKAGGYETGKLFAPTLEEATQFGKYNHGLDGVPNTIMKVKVPNSVLNGATRFEADGMNAISIPANQLHMLKATPLNYSPWLR